MANSWSVMARFMSSTDRATGAITLALGAYVAFLAAGMPLLTRGVPGPGLLPMIIGLALAAFGAMLLIRPATHAPNSGWPGREDGARVAITVGALALYTAAVPILGFPIATALFLTGLIWWWGSYRWWFAVLVGVVAALVMVLIFQVLLRAPLPSGIWG